MEQLRFVDGDNFSYSLSNGSIVQGEDSFPNMYSVAGNVITFNARTSGGPTFVELTVV